jgi:hypothetical protein
MKDFAAAFAHPAALAFMTDCCHIATSQIILPSRTRFRATVI